MRVPASTYRLQITADFTLDDAASVLPYLHDLGVDWVYLSPILRAEPGSPHGYDVVDHSVVDPARGGASGLSVLSAEARRLGMGVLVEEGVGVGGLDRLDRRGRLDRRSQGEDVIVVADDAGRGVDPDRSGVVVTDDR